MACSVVLRQRVVGVRWERGTKIIMGLTIAAATLGEVKALAQPLQTLEPETADVVSTPEATGRPVEKAPSPAAKSQLLSTGETVPSFPWDNTPPPIVVLCGEDANGSTTGSAKPRRRLISCYFIK